MVAQDAQEPEKDSHEVGREDEPRVANHPRVERRVVAELEMHSTQSNAGIPDVPHLGKQFYVHRLRV